MAKNYIDDSTINLIRSSVDIVDIIGEYISLTGAGKNFFGVCPFHDDHSPSMSVSRERQIFKCFSCGAGGNVFKFIQDFENISFMEAVKLLADKTGISVDIGNYSKPDKYLEYYDMYDLASKLYTNNINSIKGVQAKKYLDERGLDNEIIKEFKIGLALKEKNSLTKILNNKGYSDELIEKYGLANKHDYGMTDVFYNRIMVPLCDFKGQVVAFSGRVFDGSNENKYVNTKQTDVFKKGEILYNYHRSKDVARKVNQIIVVEGYMDVIALYKIGILNVVATMGTSVTKEQLSLIRKMASEIVLCFDGDKAGLKATKFCSDELTNIGINAKIIKLEKDLDPDEYIKEFGKDKFLEKLNHPINTMEFNLSYLKQDKDLTNNVDIALYINSMLKEVSKINDDILKEVTLTKISKEMDIDINLLKDKLKSQKPKIKTLKKVETSKVDKYKKAQQYLLFHMLNHEEVVKMYKKRCVYIPTDEYRELIRMIRIFYDEYNYVNEADIMTYVRDDEKLVQAINEIDNINIKEEYTLEEIDDYLKTIQDYNVKNEVKRLKKMMNETDDMTKKIELSNKILEINKMNKSDEEC